MRKMFGTSFLLIAVFSSALAQDDAMYKARESYDEAMSRVAFLLGEWQPEAVSLDPESGQWQNQEFAAGKDGMVKVEKMGAFPAFSISIPGKTLYHGALSYDVFQNKYRFVVIDSALGLLDVYEGQLVEGALQMTNLKAGTFFASGEQNFFGRVNFQPRGKSGWDLVVELSSDKGETWTEFYKLSTNPET